MAIRTVVTRGFGNGTFNGTIALVVRRGYAAAVAAAVTRRRINRQISASVAIGI